MTLQCHPNLSAINDIPVEISFLGLICEQGDIHWVYNFCIRLWKWKMFPLSLWGSYNWRKLKSSVWVAGCANLKNWKFIIMDCLIKMWSMLCCIDNVMFAVIPQDIWKFQPKATGAELCGGRCPGRASLSGLQKSLSHIKKMMHAFRNWGCNFSVLKKTKKQNSFVLGLAVYSGVTRLLHSCVWTQE